MAGCVERGPAARSTRAELCGDRMRLGTLRGSFRQLEAHSTFTSGRNSGRLFIEIVDGQESKTECAICFARTSVGDRGVK